MPIRFNGSMEPGPVGLFPEWMILTGRLMLEEWGAGVWRLTQTVWDWYGRISSITIINTSFVNKFDDQLLLYSIIEEKDQIV